MAEKQTDGYGGRLRRAMERGPLPIDSVRGLARRLQADYEDLRGATYGGVRQYVEENIRNPRIELLRALADVLGVRWEWLAYDEGGMTEEEEKARRAREEGAPTEEEPSDPSFAAINRALEEIDLFDGPSSSGLRGVAHEVIGEVLTSRGQTYPEPPLTDVEARLLVYSLRHFINGPWQLLRQSTEARWADYRAYCIAILHALLMALPEAGVVPPRTLAAQLVPLGRAAGGYWRPFPPDTLPDHVPEDERENIAQWINEALESPTEED